ncbi:MAG: class IV adenylate cyclase [Deltaproteobacteria bacterium]|nr:class IV adenylate cyclase [Deltaproteobacteria bacterium]
MGTLEIEVKFFLPHPEISRKLLARNGAESRGRFFEHNICFENAAGDLRRNESLLRLRKDDITTLTYKAKPAFTDNDFKVLTEHEVEVSDVDTMLDILRALGFYPEQVYEKYRESFALASSTVCLDSMPFGDFLEIEGPREDIRKLAGQLEMHWSRRILLNYRAMFDVIREALDLPFTDITFDNFKGVALDIEAFLPGFEAGQKQM